MLDWHLCQICYSLEIKLLLLLLLLFFFFFINHLILNRLAGVSGGFSRGYSHFRPTF